MLGAANDELSKERASRAAKGYDQRKWALPKTSCYGLQETHGEREGVLEP